MFVELTNSFVLTKTDMLIYRRRDLQAAATAMPPIVIPTYCQEEVASWNAQLERESAEAQRRARLLTMNVSIPRTSENK
jgi:endonuclease/exonuclease/phosphatase (EEP) superfamily protein YafD